MIFVSTRLAFTFIKDSKIVPSYYCKSFYINVYTNMYLISGVGNLTVVLFNIILNTIICIIRYLHLD